MSRPVKHGLDYFPVDTDIFEDEKLRRIYTRHGLIGEAVVTRLLCKIYRAGAWLIWTSDMEALFSYETRGKLRLNKLRQIIDDLVANNFFDERIFKTFQILTSNGIQRRYINICRQLHRQINIPDLYLIKSEETTSRPEASHDKRKEIKRNEIKGKEKGQPSENNISEQQNSKWYDCDPKAATRELLEKLT